MIERKPWEITRNLEDITNSDIISKKRKIKELFLNDPDLLSVLGAKDPFPLNKFADPSNPTEEELRKREEILTYNDKIQHEQILDYLKVNDIQDEVLNFIMFDIHDERPNPDNQAFKIQYIVVMIVINENDMTTEYDISRADLLDYIVRDILQWSNALGAKLVPALDSPQVLDRKYYSRELRFRVDQINSLPVHGLVNKYDRI